MTETRYRQRPIEVEAVQWTGSNAEQLRAFAGIDFDTIDPADRIDPDDDAQLLVEASLWVGIRPGDWVLKFEGYFMAKSDVPFRAVWEPAAETQAVDVEALARLLNGADVHIHNGHHPKWDSLAESGEEQYLGMARWLLKRLHVAEREPAAPAPVPSAPADQTALRDRIAAAIWERQNPGRRWADCEYRWRADAEADADAVLAVLPESADRADVLREPVNPCTRGNNFCGQHGYDCPPDEPAAGLPAGGAPHTKEARS